MSLASAKQNRNKWRRRCKLSFGSSIPHRVHKILHRIKMLDIKILESKQRKLCNPISCRHRIDLFYTRLYASRHTVLARIGDIKDDTISIKLLVYIHTTSLDSTWRWKQFYGTSSWYFKSHIYVFTVHDRGWTLILTDSLSSSSSFSFYQIAAALNILVHFETLIPNPKLHCN